jgi:hypothetical protein
MLFTLSLILTLTGVPGYRAQPEEAQKEVAMAAERPGLDDLLRQAERLLLLGEDLQRLRGDLGQPSGECVGLPRGEGGLLEPDVVARGRLQYLASSLPGVQKPTVIRVWT